MALLDGKRHHVLENQGLFAVAFFEATALTILLVLFFLLFRRDHPSSYFRLWLAAHHRPLWPLTSVVLAGVYCLERTGTPQFGPVHWQTAGLESIVSLWTGWLLWRVAASQKGYGMRLLAGAFLLERARARSEELNDKMRHLTQLIAASTQTLSVNEVLDQVLGHLVESLGATHGMCG